MEDLLTLAKAAARRVSFQWPSVIEEDDLAQDVVLRLLDSPGALQRIETEDEISVKAFMVKVAHQVASDQMVDYDHFSGNYLYDTVEVRVLLEEQAWLLKSNKLSAEIMDLKEAMKNLVKKNSGYYADLVNKYQHEIDYSDNTGKSRIRRGVASLTEEMNWIGVRRRKDFIEGPGSRKAYTSKAGQVSATTDWQGDYGDGRR